MNPSPPRSDRPGLALENISAGYGAVAVLRALNVNIPYGSFTAVVGPNGSGKSTLLKTLVGVLEPLAGRIRWDPLDGRAPRIGYVPQRESLDPNYPLSTFDVVLMGAYGRIGSGRWISREEKELARECLRTTGVAEASDRLFATLSGGQKQRALIARALVVQPDLLALDEPTAGVDPAGSAAIMELLDRFNRERGITVLMVNHDWRAVRQWARDAIWLRRGEAVPCAVSDLAKPETIEQLLDWQ